MLIMHRQDAVLTGFACASVLIMCRLECRGVLIVRRCRRGFSKL